jgi:hypothetical protein
MNTELIKVTKPSNTLRNRGPASVEFVTRRVPMPGRPQLGPAIPIWSQCYTRTRPLSQCHIRSESSSRSFESGKWPSVSYQLNTFELPLRSNSAAGEDRLPVQVVECAHAGLNTFTETQIAISNVEAKAGKLMSTSGPV